MTVNENILLWWGRLGIGSCGDFSCYDSAADHHQQRTNNPSGGFQNLGYRSAGRQQYDSCPYFGTVNQPLKSHIGSCCQLH